MCEVNVEEISELGSDRGRELHNKQANEKLIKPSKVRMISGNPPKEVDMMSTVEEMSVKDETKSNTPMKFDCVSRSSDLSSSSIVASTTNVKCRKKVACITSLESPTNAIENCLDIGLHFSRKTNILRSQRSLQMSHIGYRKIMQGGECM